MKNSVFNNFYAEKFNKFPEKRYCRVELSDACRNWLLEHVPKETNLWLFGLAPIFSQANQNTFGYPDARLNADPIYRSLIPDSWFDTLDFLVSIPTYEKPITIILTIGFLASVSDPRPVLLAYKKLALKRKTSCFILFHLHDGYLRRWSLKNFLSFLNASGFGVISTSTIDDTYISIRISYDVVQQQKNITNSKIKVTASEVNTLVVSVTDAPVRRATDILFDVKNIIKLSQNSICVTNSSEYKDVYNGRCLIVKELLGDISKEDLVNGIGLIEAIKAALYLLPSVRSIEIYSEDTVAFRVIQAKRTGQLPKHLTITTSALNSIDHAKAQLHNRTAMNYEITELRELVRQAYIFKYADISYFRSDELVRLLEGEFGYCLGNPHVRRMPLELSDVKKLDATHFFTASVLIVVVNIEQEKDWQNLLNFIKPLIKPMTKRAIREVIFLTKIRPPKSDLLEIENLVKCSWQQLISNETVQRLCIGFQSRGIFLIQTSSDEFFDAIWLMQLHGCRYFLKQDAETLFYKFENERLHSNFYKVGSTDDAAMQFCLAMEEPIEQQLPRLADVQARSLSEQRKTNKSYIESESKDLIVASFRTEYFLDVSLVSPVFNTPIPYLIDLFESLEVSTIQPKEWILINDGSTIEYLSQLEEFVLKRSTCHLPIRLVSQKNGGLAAARNLGLAVSNTKFTYFLDSDDVLLSHTLSDALVAMWVDPRYVAVAGLLVYFSEKQAQLDGVTIHRIDSYWPSVGIPDNKVLGLLENDYISASGLFNTQLMRNAGGWDAFDKTMWEDWALYNKLAWSGAEFGLIPNVGHLYRNTPGSMAKTYNPYFGRRRLVRNMPGMNKFDAHILYALTNQQMTKVEHQKILDLIYSSRSWRITRPFRILLKLLRLDFSAACIIYKNKDK